MPLSGYGGCHRPYPLQVRCTVYLSLNVSGAGAQVVTRLHALYAETTRLLHLVLARVVVQGCTDFRPGAYRRTWLTLV
jgi:hypothetical protein